MIHCNILTLINVCPCIIYEIDERYQLDATILFIIINNSIYFGHRIQTYTQCTGLHTGSSGPQAQHLMVNTICCNIQPVLLKMGI